MDADLYLSILKRRLKNDSSTLIPLNRIVVAQIVEMIEQAQARHDELREILRVYACDCKETCSEDHRKEYYCGAGARSAVEGGA